MAERPCAHGMPTPASCWECMEDGAVPVPSRSNVAPTVQVIFAARFGGQCAACNLGIHEGQRVARMSDETYRHAHCAVAA